MVDLPAPEGPTSPTNWPGWIVKETSLSTGADGWDGYANVTALKETLAPRLETGGGLASPLASTSLSPLSSASPWPACAPAVRPSSVEFIRSRILPAAFLLLPPREPGQTSVPRAVTTRE